MLYFITCVLFVVGFLYHCSQKIGDLRKKFTTLPPKDIIKTFITEEWDTFLVASLGLILLELTIFIVAWKQIKVPNWVEQWGVFAFAVVWGYCSQRLAYRIFGTAESVLNKRVDNAFVADENEAKKQGKDSVG